MKHVNPHIISSHRFRSDGSVNARGFKIVYESVVCDNGTTLLAPAATNFTSEGINSS